MGLTGVGQNPSFDRWSGVRTPHRPNGLQPSWRSATSQETNGMRERGMGALSKGWLILAVVLSAGCGGAEPTGIVEPDPEVEPFVGDWEASEFTVTNSADTTDPFDVTEGGSFTINVQPSGQYTAILEFPELPTPVVEVGQMSVVGNSITLRPQGGTPATSSYEFQGSDRLTLDGPTEFDFNRDGTPEPGEAHIVLQRVS
ncbi:MAG: hypothetical protein WD995_02835 [Gemmatimonadota bacterium]